MRITENKLRKIIRQKILEYGGVPNFKDWYAADRGHSSKKKSPDAIAQEVEEQVYNGEIPGDPNFIYKEVEALCQRAGCPDKVDYVAEKVINAILASGY